MRAEGGREGGGKVLAGGRTAIKVTRPRRTGAAVTHRSLSGKTFQALRDHFVADRLSGVTALTACVGQ